MTGCPTWSELPANLEVVTMGVPQAEEQGYLDMNSCPDSNSGDLGKCASSQYQSYAGHLHESQGSRL